MNWLRRRPWLWVIALSAFGLGLSVGFAWIAIAHPPEPIPAASPRR